MSAIRRIAILFHERHHDALSGWYRIWALAPHWRKRGISVEPVWGVGKAIDADLLIPHVDLSYMPDEYWAVIQSHPRVVNRHVRDIRKTAFSDNLVRPGDAWRGPVIVKTNENGRGWMENLLFGPGVPTTRAARLMSRMAQYPWIERRRLGSVRMPARYHIFERTESVPRGVWSNPALVVERFLPERSGSQFAMRTYTFFGDRAHGRIFRGPDPWMKAWNSEMGELTSAPEAIVAVRHRLKLDYAKLDYVMHDGEPILLDVNRTPGMSAPIDERRIERSAELAMGLDYFGTV